MVHEYAVEPELIATWINRKDGRYFVREFGLGSPRIISQYPGSWKKRVWAAYNASADGNQSARKRMEVLIAKLSSVTTRRPDADWNQELAWLENASREHQRAPFHAILTRRESNGHPSILVADDVDETVPLWNHPHSVPVSRTPKQISRAVGEMLRIATDIVFVDPYFAPHRPRFFNVIKECFRMCFEDRAVARPRLRILSSDIDANGRFQLFEMECRKRLPRILPRGQKVTICRLSERPGGQELHNRYILTEHGGVAFGTGLDEKEKAKTTDDLTLLDQDSYRLRWRQYASDQPAFDRPEGEITVVGSGRSPKRTQPAGRQ